MIRKFLNLFRNGVYFDQYLFISITLLSLMGLVFLFSASQGNIETTIKQSFFVLFGLILMFAVSQPDPDFYKNNSLLFFLISVLLVVITLLTGKEINGAKRWLDLGFFTLQTSEIIKITLPVFLASYLFDKSLPISFKNTIVSLILIFFIVNLVRIQPDLGTSLVILIAGLYILFLAGLSWRFIGVSAGLFTLSLPYIWNNFLEPFQKQRILTLFDPNSDPYGSGWNITQSKIAIGSGGFFGKGYLKGTQSYLEFLPEKHTDFIFTLFSEEFGFLGSIILLFLYILLIYRIINVGLVSRSFFAKLYCFGFATAIFLYVFVNIAMVLGMLPIVGAPLPIMSYGGSSLLSIMLGLSIVMSCKIYNQEQISVY